MQYEYTYSYSTAPRSSQRNEQTLVCGQGEEGRNGKKKKKKRKTENNTIIRYYSSSTVYSIIRIRFLAVRASTCTVLHAALWVCTSCRKYDSSCVTPRVAFLRFQSACRRRIRGQGNTLLFERSIHIIRSAPVLCSSSSPPPHPRFFFFSSLLPSAIGIASEL